MRVVMLEFLRERADANGELAYADYIRHVLYAPELGYYRRPAARIGQDATTDFYTATSLGPLFGQLIAEAAVNLLGQHDSPSLDPADVAFVEVGAEAGRTVLDEAGHPFREVQGVGVDAEMVASGPRVLFSNELFDAQPFERLVLTERGWAERRVRVEEDGLQEVRRPLERNLGVALPDPQDLPLGYQLDLPLAAVDLLRQLVAGEWPGVFIAIDYGLPWDILATERPHGTARTYRHHEAGTNLLAHPGETDVTCHVCWDWLVEALQSNGFRRVDVMRQEAFFMHLAPKSIQRAISDPAALSTDRQALKALLHPHHFGSKFQVLVGLR